MTTHTLDSFDLTYANHLVAELWQHTGRLLDSVACHHDNTFEHELVAISYKTTELFDKLYPLDYLDTPAVTGATTTRDTIAKEIAVCVNDLTQYAIDDEPMIQHFIIGLLTVIDTYTLISDGKDSRTLANAYVPTLDALKR